MSSEEIVNENFIIEEEFPDHHFRTELPNILEEISLSHLQFRIYWAIKKVAGDKGKSWQSMDAIAKRCGCSIRALQTNLASLCVNFPILKNRPLIKLQKRKKPDGSWDTSIIHIVNIWDVNGTFYREKLAKKQAEKDQLGGGAANAPGVVQQMHQGGAANAPKEETEKKNRDSAVSIRAEITETHKTISPPLPPVSGFSEKSLPFQKDRKKVTALNADKNWYTALPMDQREVFDEAIRFVPPKGPKLEQNFLTAMLKKHGAARVKDAFEHSKQACIKTEIKNSFGGMVRVALDKGFRPMTDEAYQNREMAKKICFDNPSFKALEKYVSHTSGWSYDYTQRDFLIVLCEKVDSMKAYA
jgi:hypothetical protein